MLAAVYEKVGKPLVIKEVAKPICGEDELLVRVEACGICRTDLHILDGDLPPKKLPLIRGHEVVGIIEDTGNLVTNFTKKDRIGIPWLGGSCGTCEFCKKGKENLCDLGQYSGYHRNGGFAEFTTCRADFDISLPIEKDAPSLAPLLCRSYWRSFLEKSGL